MARRRDKLPALAAGSHCITHEHPESRKSHNVERREQQAYREEHGAALRADAVPHGGVAVHVAGGAAYIGRRGLWHL